MKLDIIKRMNGSTERLVIDEARMLWPNFSGADGYKPQFNVIIPEQEMADALIADVNEYGAAWKVKMKPPRDENDTPLIYLPVNVGIYAEIYVQSGDRMVMLDHNAMGQIDRMDIDYIELDIKPSDKIIRGEAHRTAYLDGIVVHQRSNRFTERYLASRINEEPTDECK